MTDDLISFTEKDASNLRLSSVLNEFDPLTADPHAQKTFDSFGHSELKLHNKNALANYNTSNSHAHFLSTFPIDEYSYPLPHNNFNSENIISSTTSRKEDSWNNFEAFDLDNALICIPPSTSKPITDASSSPSCADNSSSNTEISKPDNSQIYTSQLRRSANVHQKKPNSSLFCVDEELQSFHKTIEKFSQLLSSDASDEVNSSRLPRLINGYLVDEVTAAGLGLHLQCGRPNVSNDWRISPILERITSLVPSLEQISAPTCKLPVMVIKVFVPYALGPSSSTSEFEPKKLCLERDPYTTSVRELIRLSVKSAFPDESELPDLDFFCLRISRRRDLLHPNGMLCDINYIQTCYRLDTPIHLVLEEFSRQESFLPSEMDRADPLSLHDNYMEKYGIPPEETIETLCAAISKAIQNTRNFIRNPSAQDSFKNGPKSIKSELEQTINAFTTIVCQNIILTPLLKSLRIVQIGLDDLLTSNKNQVNNVGNSLSPLPDVGNEHIKALDTLVRHLESQVSAFLKWKQAWYPQLSLFRSHSLLAPSCPLAIHENTWLTDEDSFTLPSSLTEKKVTHRTAKYMEPLIVGVMSLRNWNQELFSIPDLRDGLNNSSDNPAYKPNLNAYIRVHLGLSYAGRQMRFVCSPYFEPTRRSACTSSLQTPNVPVVGDSHFSKEASISRLSPKSSKFLEIKEWFYFTHFSINRIPREAILNISLVSLKKQTNDPAVLKTGTLLGWANVPLFDAFHKLRHDRMFIGLWPPNPDITTAQRSTFTMLNRDKSCTVVELAFPTYNCELMFATPELTDHLDFEFCGSDGFNSEAEKACNQATESIYLLNIDYRRSAISAMEAYKRYQLYSTTRNNSRIALSDLTQFDSSDRQLREKLPDFIAFLPQVKQEAVEVLWAFRGHLLKSPDALVALLVGAPTTWPAQCRQPGNLKDSLSVLWLLLLSRLYAVMAISKPVDPAHALRLLAPDVADQCIRHWAVSCLSSLPSDSLIPYLPALLPCVNYDIYMDWSGLVSLLMHRSTTSLRFCNALFWEIQNIVKAKAWFPQHRLLLMSASLVWLRGSLLSNTWKLQSTMLASFQNVATAVKEQPNVFTRRHKTLMTGVDDMQMKLKHLLASSLDRPGSQPSGSRDCRPSAFRLPYDFGLSARAMNKPGCDYFNSNTCPLRLSFLSASKKSSSFSTMFKIGDDLRSDALICLLLKFADSAWLSVDLDLKMVHYKVLPTDFEIGFIELVKECTTLRHIQDQNSGLRKAFSDTVLIRWLKSMHKKEEALSKALENFLFTAVGGCVLTYVLGIGDRHNDNILVRYSGHLFHIDFSKVFGNFQTIVGINRDRAPFALSSDMVRVINDACALAGSRNQDEHNVFSTLCCRAYAEMRKHKFSIISLMEAALQSGLPELTVENICYVYEMLRPVDNDEEADNHFTQQVHKSKISKTTKLNFVMHGWAQNRPGASTGIRPSINVFSSSPPSIYGIYGDYQNVDASDSIIEKIGDYEGIEGAKADLPFFLSISVTGVVKKRETFVSNLIFSLQVRQITEVTPYLISRTSVELQNLIAALQNELPDHQAVQSGTDVGLIIGSLSVSEEEASRTVQNWFDALLQANSPIIGSDAIRSFVKPKLFECNSLITRRFHSDPSSFSANRRGWSHILDDLDLPTAKKDSPLLPLPARDYLIDVNSDQPDKVKPTSQTSAQADWPNLPQVGNYHQTLPHNPGGGYSQPLPPLPPRESKNLARSANKAQPAPVMNPSASRDCGDQEVSVELQLSRSQQSLVVFVKGGRNWTLLTAISEPANYIVRLGILPNLRRYETLQKTYRKTSDFPKFNSKFTIEITKAEQDHSYLTFAALQSYPGNVAYLLGEVAIPLGSVPLCPEHSTTWYSLRRQAAERA